KKKKKKNPPPLTVRAFFSTKGNEVTTMRVLKFGGTSVANAERFLRVADILESNARQGQ
ncbi:putative bifunctional aspartokinase I/homoserine dehydrogenase I, partial [Escherichia coli MS 21-1]